MKLRKYDTHFLLLCFGVGAHGSTSPELNIASNKQNLVLLSET